MNIDLHLFFDDENTIPGYYAAKHVVEIPLKYPSFENFKTLVFLKWFRNDLRYFDVRPFSLLAKIDGNITVINYPDMLRLEEVLEKIICYEDHQYVIVENLTIS